MLIPNTSGGCEWSGGLQRQESAEGDGGVAPRPREHHLHRPALHRVLVAVRKDPLLLLFLPPILEQNNHQVVP